MLCCDVSLHEAPAPWQHHDTPGCFEPERSGKNRGISWNTCFLHKGILRSSHCAHPPVDFYSALNDNKLQRTPQNEHPSIRSMTTTATNRNSHRNERRRETATQNLKHIHRLYTRTNTDAEAGANTDTTTRTQTHTERHTHTYIYIYIYTRKSYMPA